MRSRPIDVEEALWWRLRGRKLGGLKFRRQHPIAGFIADFVCVEARLVVELDGKQHQGAVRDLRRSEELFDRGFKVIRFDNERVRIDIDEVCSAILETASAQLQTPHPPASRAPSPTRGEG
jgi:very-short-patch-repair endonuclease